MPEQRTTQTLTGLAGCLLVALIAIIPGAIIAQPAGRAQPEDFTFDAYLQAQVMTARAACARELGISPLPDNDIDLVARYGLDKMNAFKDCVLHKL